nr:hypothetical protein [Tanacetum cinerariifolium]
MKTVGKGFSGNITPLFPTMMVRDHEEMGEDDEASLGDQEDTSKQGRKIHDIDADEDIALKHIHDVDMFRVHVLMVMKCLLKSSSTCSIEECKPKATTTPTTTTATTTVTSASTRSKTKGVVIQEQEQSSTPITSSKDKGKGIMVKESLKMKKKDQQESSKRAGQALEQESSKKQKLEEDKESEELKKCLAIVSDDGDDVTIDATPLSTKSPGIVDYKIHQEGKKFFSKLSEQMTFDVDADDDVLKFWKMVIICAGLTQ